MLDVYTDIGIYELKSTQGVLNQSARVIQEVFRSHCCGRDQA